MRAQRRWTRLRLVGKQMGPGLITGAADDDPSGIATYSQAGAQFGYAMLWTMPVIYPLMVAVQLVSARIGRVTGKGLAHNMREVLPGWAVNVLVLLLVVANTINIGADLAVMGDALALVVNVNTHAATIALALTCLLLQLFVPYYRYARVLKWLTFSLLAYVAVLVFVTLDYAAVVKGLLVPSLPAGGMTMIVAVLGTTISPYLFFWQSGQEVEEIEADEAASPLLDAPVQANRHLRRIRIDTIAGMAASNAIAVAIMIATAATLNAGNVTINSATEAAQALRPAAGRFAELIFALGIVGTGLLAVPVLAGSAAYAVGDRLKVRASLGAKPREAIAFYSVIVLAIAIGVAIDWSPIGPMQALIWSAVVNGVVAAPLLAVMMLVVRRGRIMGEFTGSTWEVRLGWLATAVMAVAALAMFAQMLVPGLDGVRP